MTLISNRLQVDTYIPPSRSSQIPAKEKDSHLFWECVSGIILISFLGLGIFQKFNEGQREINGELQRFLKLKDCEKAYKLTDVFFRQVDRDISKEHVTRYCPFDISSKAAESIKDFSTRNKAYQNILNGLFTRKEYDKAFEWIETLDNVSRDDLLIIVLRKIYQMSATGEGQLNESDASTDMTISFRDRVTLLVFSRLSRCDAVEEAFKFLLPKLLKMKKLDEAFGWINLMDEAYRDGIFEVLLKLALDQPVTYYDQIIDFVTANTLDTALLDQAKAGVNFNQFYGVAFAKKSDNLVARQEKIQLNKLIKRGDIEEAFDWINTGFSVVKRDKMLLVSLEIAISAKSPQYDKVRKYVKSEVRSELVKTQVQKLIRENSHLLSFSDIFFAALTF